MRSRARLHLVLTLTKNAQAAPVCLLRTAAAMNNIASAFRQANGDIRHDLILPTPSRQRNLRSLPLGDG